MQTKKQERKILKYEHSNKLIKTVLNAH